ncbi:TPA: VasL domain-containing protein [Escherichia coli]
MKIHRPLWAEGTFLSSQQFQQQARWEAFSNDSIAQLCIRHPWGIANVLFDRDALMSGKLKTQAVRLRFADGTLIDSDVSDVLPLACDLHALTNDSAVVLLALPLAHGNGGNLGQGEQTERPLQRLSAQLDALDERKGRYLTGSELKTAVYGIRQSLKEPPLEELLRQLEEQKQTGEVSPTLLTQIDTRLNQLLNRYVILLDTKVEQSQ